ncbi:MAG: SPOR domain-containing protein [Bacteroidaceae bacterium]|nr:SPOR domain-containing protein [Bacteroidaceae bacterium]
MKKTLLMGIALISALAFTACKSSESSYKKAYEKAKAQEMSRTVATDQVDAAPVAVTPVVTTPTTTVQPNTENDRQERLEVMNGGTLKAFNVVCGSFSKVDNANNLRNTLVAKGYSAQVAQNPETGMYRVIATSFDDRASAISSRDQLRGTYPDAWILYRTY